MTGCARRSNDRASGRLGGEMSDSTRSLYEPVGLRAVRPYVIVGDADVAINFYVAAFDAEELERHETPPGGFGHAKVQIGESIVEIGEHPDAGHREPEAVPRIG